MLNLFELCQNQEPLSSRNHQPPPQNMTNRPASTYQPSEYRATNSKGQGNNSIDPNPNNTNQNNARKIIERGGYICECLDGYFDPKNEIITGEVIVRNKETGRVVYEGQFFKSQKCGFGVQYNDKGEVQYEGEFFQGKRNGCGRTKFYEGEFRNNDYDGWGRFFTSEVIYQGYFQVGKYHGLGFYMKAKDEFKRLDILHDEQKIDQFIANEMSKDQNRLFEEFNIEQIYTGQWQKGLKNGLGKISQENGYWYSGQFAYNSIFGNGTRKMNGKVERGTFIKGQFKK